MSETPCKLLNCKTKAFYSESLSLKSARPVATRWKREQESYCIAARRLVSARRLPTHTHTHIHSDTLLRWPDSSSKWNTANESSTTYTFNVLLWAQSSIYDPKNCKALRSISACIRDCTSSCEDLYCCSCTAACCKAKRQENFDKAAGVERSFDRKQLTDKCDFSFRKTSIKSNLNMIFGFFLLCVKKLQ